MHRLLPPPIIEIDTDDAYRDPRPAIGRRPWLMMNMISSLDGGIEFDGVSGPLGSPGDKDVFGSIRAIPDVILAGATTVSAERYNPPSTSVSTRARRLANRAWATARIAVVSGSLDLDLSIPMFDAPGQRPIVITTTSAADAKVARVEQAADVLAIDPDPNGHVDLAAALIALGELGANVVLSEGGPTLNGQLLAADLVDEICLSLAPLALAGDASRLARGPSPEAPGAFDLRHVLTEDHYLFLRYTRAR